MTIEPIIQNTLAMLKDDGESNLGNHVRVLRSLMRAIPDPTPELDQVIEGVAQMSDLDAYHQMKENDPHIWISHTAKLHEILPCAIGRVPIREKILQEYGARNTPSPQAETYLRYFEELLYKDLEENSTSTRLITEDVEPYQHYKNPQIRHLLFGGRTATIGDYAFSGCNYLQTVTFSDGVRSINPYAFADCNTLHTIHINATLQDIGKGAFAGCKSIKQLLVSPDNQTFKVVGNCLLSHDGKRLVFCISQESLFCIPDGVETIGAGAFEHCLLLEIVIFPPTVQQIEKNAFANCPKLRTATIYNAQCRLDEGVFAGCAQLESIYGVSRLDDARSKLLEGSVKDAGVFLAPKIWGFYTGNLINGKPHDRDAVFCRDNKVVYRGAFEQGKMQGNGRLTSPDGTQTWVGAFVDNKRHDLCGTIITANGENPEPCIRGCVLPQDVILGAAADLNAQIADLNAQIEDKNSRIDTLQNELEGLRKALLERLRKTLLDQTERADTKEQECVCLKQKIETPETEISSGEIARSAQEDEQSAIHQKTAQTAPRDTEPPTTQEPERDKPLQNEVSGFVPTDNSHMGAPANPYDLTSGPATSLPGTNATGKYTFKLKHRQKDVSFAVLGKGFWIGSNIENEIRDRYPSYQPARNWNLCEKHLCLKVENNQLFAKAYGPIQIDGQSIDIGKEVQLHGGNVLDLSGEIFEVIEDGVS